MCYGRNTRRIDSMEEKSVHIVVRIPRPLRKLIEQHLKLDTHKDLSEFVRDALREKIWKEAPELYSKLFSEIEKKPTE